MAIYQWLKAMGGIHVKFSKNIRKFNFLKYPQTFHTCHGVFRNRLGDIVSPLWSYVRHAKSFWENRKEQLKNSCFPAIWRQIFEYLHIKPRATTIWRRIREFHVFPRLVAWRSATLTIQTQHVHMSYFGPSLRFFPRLALSEMAMGKLLVTLTYERF